MKKLTFTLVLPLAVISFHLIIMWTYAVITDATDEIFHGFPLPYACRTLHTSMGTQFFLTEMIIDFLVYFSFWWMVMYSMNRMAGKLKIHASVLVLLIAVSCLFLYFSTIFTKTSGDLIKSRNPYELKILDRGVEYIWTHKEHPDYSEYETETHHHR